MSIANFTDFNIGQFQRAVTNSAMTDHSVHHNYIYYNTLDSSLLNQGRVKEAAVDMNHKRQRVPSDPNYSHKRWQALGDVRIRPGSALKKKSIVPPPPAFLLLLLLPILYIVVGFLFFFCRELKNSPDFLALAAAAAAHQ